MHHISNNSTSSDTPDFSSHPPSIHDIFQNLTML